ncbi:MAG: hypothetical protein IKJ38_02380 [Alistipes sp.]|nr:hypothetical protein [Alistipes sp.]
MNVNLRYTLVAIVMLLCVGATYAQTPISDAEPSRTRLVPYATAESAAKRSMAKQRYMQPIVEWTEVDGVLRGEFTYPFSWVERRIYLRIERVHCPYEIFVNGKRAGGSSNGFVAAEFDITKISREDKNRVELRLLPTSDVAHIESFEHAAPHPEVYIISQPRVRVRDVDWRATKGVGGVVNVDFSVVMHNATLGEKSSCLYYELYLNDTIRLAAGHRDVVLGMYGVDTMRFGATLRDSMLWSSVSPTLLSLRLKNRIAGRDVEFFDLAVALRELRYANGAFAINGDVVNVEWYDVAPTITTDELRALCDAGHRAIRFTAGGVSDEMLTLCDEMGILVALTAPINSSRAGSSRQRGGNPSNDPSWRDEYVARTEQMIHTSKRHASVVAYFLADDSANGICLYESYIAAKRIAGNRPVFYMDGGREWNSDDNR